MGMWSRVLWLALFLVAGVLSASAASVNESSVTLLSDAVRYPCGTSCMVNLSLNVSNSTLQDQNYTINITQMFSFGLVNITNLTYSAAANGTFVQANRSNDSAWFIPTYNTSGDLYLNLSIGLDEAQLRDWNVTISLYNGSTVFTITLPLNLGIISLNTTNETRYNNSDAFTVPFFFDASTISNMSCALYYNDTLQNTTNATNQQPASVSMGISSYTFANASWYLNCTDLLDANASYATKNRTLVVDRPVLSLVNNRSSYNDTAFNLTFNVTDALYSNVTCRVDLNGSAYLAYTSYNSSPQTVQVNLSGQGNSTLAVVCYNNISSAYTESLTTQFYADYAAPTIAVHHSQAVVTTNSSFLFNFSANDNFDALVNCNLTIDGASAANVSLNASAYAVHNETGWSQAQHNWTFACYDSLENSANKTGYVTYDVTAPSITTLTYANNNTVSGSAWQQITFGVTELVPRNIEVIGNVTTQNITWTTGMSAFNATFTSAAHRFYLRFCDQLGQCNETGNMTITVDLNVPAIAAPVLYLLNGSVLSTSASSATNATDVRLVFNVSDAESGVNVTTVYYDYVLTNTTIVGAPQATFNTTFSVSLPGLHRFVITANDSAGNVYNRSVDFYSSGTLNLSSVESHFLSTAANLSLLSFAVFTYNGTATVNQTANSSFDPSTTINITLTLNDSVGTQVEVLNADGMTLFWNASFKSIIDDASVTSAVNAKGSGVRSSFTFGNFSHLVGGSYGLLISNNDTAFDYVFHCTTYASCTSLANTSSRAALDAAGVGFNRNGSRTYIKVASFSSIVMGNDTLVSPANLSGTSNSSSSGSLYLDVQFGENVTANISVTHNQSGTPFTNRTSFVVNSTFGYAAMLDTLGDLFDGRAYSDGDHYLNLTYCDTYGHCNSTGMNITFNFTATLSLVLAPYNTNHNYGGGSDASVVAYIYSANNVPFLLNISTVRDGSIVTQNQTDVAAPYGGDAFNHSVTITSDEIEINEFYVITFIGCDLEGSCTAQKVVNFSNHAVSSSESEDTSTTTPTITPASSTSSEQTKLLEEIWGLLSKASSSLNSGDSSSTVRAKLDDVYDKEQELQELFRSTFSFMDELRINNLSGIGLSMADYERGKDYYDDAKVFLSESTSLTNQSERFKKLDSASSKQSLARYNLPEIRQTNKFTDTRKRTQGGLADALLLATEDDAKKAIKAINLSKSVSADVKKERFVYSVRNDERSSKQINLTKVIITYNAKADQTDMVLIEIIPKSVSADVSSMTLVTTPSKVLQDDPILLWKKGSLDNGDVYKVTYIVPKEIIKDTSVTLYDAVQEVSSDDAEEILALTGNATTESITGSAISNVTGDGNETALSSLFGGVSTKGVIIISALIMGLLVLGGAVVIHKRKPKKPDPMHAAEAAKKQGDELRKKTLEEVITRGLESGLTIAEIKTRLLEKGWPAHIVDHTIEQLSFNKHVRFKSDDEKNP